MSSDMDTFASRACEDGVNSLMAQHNWLYLQIQQFTNLGKCFSGNIEFVLFDAHHAQAVGRVSVVVVLVEHVIVELVALLQLRLALGAGRVRKVEVAQRKHGAGIVLVLQ